MYTSFKSSLFNPLMPLHATNSNGSPLLCIPGAGASITSFMELIDSLGEHWPVYGLQPRGINLAEPPHETVEDAALCNLNVLDQLNGDGPIHLLGHSHGGFVAFEMASRLYEQGCPAASLTLVDTEPPEATLRRIDTSEIFSQFIKVFEDMFDKTLVITKDVIQSGQIRPFVHELHAALIRAKCLPVRSTPEMLQGPLATFAAALQTSYTPAVRYPHKVHLVLVSDKRLDKDSDLKQREAHVTQWRRAAPNLEVWYGPGHHFSILQAPHVHALAKWWRQSRELSNDSHNV